MEALSKSSQSFEVATTRTSALVEQPKARLCWQGALTGFSCQGRILFLNFPVCLE